MVDDLRIFFEGLEQAREHYAFGEELISGVIKNQAAIDAQIKVLAKNWEFERIAKIDLALLRIAMFEMLHRTDIPPVVSINEAIDISKQFSNADSKRFINGILDRLKDQLRRGRAQGFRNRPRPCFPFLKKFEGGPFGRPSRRSRPKRTEAFWRTAHRVRPRWNLSRGGALRCRLRWPDDGRDPRGDRNRSPKGQGSRGKKGGRDRGAGADARTRGFGGPRHEGRHRAHGHRPHRSERLGQDDNRRSEARLPAEARGRIGSRRGMRHVSRRRHRSAEILARRGSTWSWCRTSRAPILRRQSHLDAVQAARSRGRGLGHRGYGRRRLHTKGNLMEELQKIRRVIAKIDPPLRITRGWSSDGSLGTNSIGTGAGLPQELRPHGPQ